MILEELVNRIVDHMQLKYERELGALHVRDIISCREKLRYEDVYPVLHRSLYFKPAILLGELVHVGLENFYPPDLRPQKVTRLLHGKEIVGHVDGVTETIALEVKYQRVLPQAAHDHHMLQAQAEAWVAEKDKAVLLYVTPEGWREFTFEPLSTDEMALYVSKGFAPRWPKWECRYCAFGGVCPKYAPRGVEHGEKAAVEEG